MSNKSKKKKKHSIMNTVKKGLKSIRNKNSKNKNKHVAITPFIPSFNNTTSPFIPSVNNTTLKDYSSNRKSSFIPSFSYRPGHNQNITSPFIPSDGKFSNYADVPKLKQSTKLKSSSVKLKSSPTKCRFPFNVPSLYINRIQKNEFAGVHHLSYDKNGIMNKVVIPLNIDIETIYNDEYDTNYNHKLLG
eukprot:132925_1